MENNFDNIPENQEQRKEEQNKNTAQETQQYTDPNEGANPAYSQNPSAQYTYQQQGQSYGNTNYQQFEQNYGNVNSQQQGQNYGNTNYQQQYQDNYNYNVGNHTGYEQGYQESADTAPLSMGEWVLTLLLMSIPCVNIILCCVWAFGKNGNVNRRNFCRAELIFIGIGTAFGIIMMIVIMTAAIGSGGYYYY